MNTSTSAAKAYAAYAEAQDSSKLGVDTVLEIARDLHLDEAKFRKDMIRPACRDHVQSDMAELEKWHINATPSFHQRPQLPVGLKTRYSVHTALAIVAGSVAAMAGHRCKADFDKYCAGKVVCGKAPVARASTST